MLLFALINFVCGYYVLRCDACYAESLLNLIIERNLDYWDLRRHRNCTMSLHMLRRDYSALMRLLGENARYVKIATRGLPFILKRYRRRLGIPAGAALFAFLLWLSTQFIWQISVVGSREVNERQILDRLAGLGCEVGTYIPALDFHELTNEYLLRYDDASWISVNMEGTEAKVELRCQIPAPELFDEKAASNIVASRDAQIDWLEVYSGHPEVRTGDVVTAGSLLISGVTERKDGGSGIERAAGHVYARTLRTFRVEIPRAAVRREYTSRSEERKTVKIFNKNIKLYINDVILFGKYDRIISEEAVEPFGCISLPITLATERFLEYEEVGYQRTDEEMREEALAQMNAEVSSETAAAEILSRDTKEYFEGENYIVECSLVCLEDIAVERPLGITG